MMSDGSLSGTFDLRAPRDITPARFFEEWLPRQVENSRELLETFAGDLSFVVSVRVTGERGGEWTVKLADRKPEFVSGLDPQAVVTFIVSEDNFIQSITGQLDDLRPPARDMTAVDTSPTAIQQRARQVHAGLKELRGSLRAELDDPNRALGVTVKFAGEMKDSPDCTIKIKMDHVRAMASGELDPQVAFMTGKIKIEGDSSLLMQLLAVMM
jgi:SCP-2 sterol transfer family